MENVVEIINETLVSLGMNQSIADNLDKLLAFVLIVGIACTVHVVCKHIILRFITGLVTKTKVTWDDIVFDRKVMIHFTRTIAPLLVYAGLPLIFGENPKVLDFLQRICQIVIAIFLMCFANALIKAVYQVHSEMEQYRDRPMKGLFQTMQVVLFLMGSVCIVAVLIHKSPTAIFATLGASAAILMLVFKDIIMGFISGVQLSANNMLRVGDWITMPKYDANGCVIEVSLSTVKVQNWDNTIITIPPYALIGDSFQNWRGMSESGGRRIKRFINIDMNSVMFCTPEMLDKYRKIHYVKDYIERTEEAVRECNEKHHADDSVRINDRRLTNLGVFRVYLTEYLKNLPEVNHDLRCLARYLQPTETGIPIELYFFSIEKDWLPYETLQADVFNHVLAVVREFDLRVFQNPTGKDFRELIKRCNM